MAYDHHGGSLTYHVLGSARVRRFALSIFFAPESSRGFGAWRVNEGDEMPRSLTDGMLDRGVRSAIETSRLRPVFAPEERGRRTAPSRVPPASRGALFSSSRIWTEFPRNADVSLTTPTLAGATVGGVYKEL